MTKNQQGRYCDSCCKTVVDFQLMTDQQILNYFNTTQGKTCGRFTSDQLNRSLEETKIEKKKGWQWLMASIASFFFFVNRSNAQALQGKVAYKPQEAKIKKQRLLGEPFVKSTIKKVEKKICSTALTGAVAMIKPSDLNKKAPVTLQQALTGDTIIFGKKVPQLIGSVTDEKGVAIPYAVVETKIAGVANMNNTNEIGEFEFKNPMIKHGDSVVMKFSCMGYEDKIVPVTFDESQLELHVQLKEKATQLQEVVVVSSNTIKGKIVMAGGIGSYISKPIKKVDTISTIVRKVFNTESFKIFPNPASKGKAVNLTIKQTGDYTIQLLDNNSRVLHVENATVNGKQEIKLFSIPATTPSGLYYIRLINEKTKKQYIDKLIVQ